MQLYNRLELLLTCTRSINSTTSWHNSPKEAEEYTGIVVPAHNFRVVARPFSTRSRLGGVGKVHRRVGLMVEGELVDVVSERADSKNPEVVEESEKPLFSFGVITDIQYADIENGKSFLGTPRYYRHALQSLHRAVDAWNSKGNLAFSIHFGDIVDGYCPKDQSREAFNRVLSEFKNFKGASVYHMIGNHCLYNLPRTELNELLEIPPSEDDISYYSFCPVPEYLFVVLDGYDVSALGWPKGHPHTEAGVRLLDTKNPNIEKNSPEGLNGVERRFVKFNGGIGKCQLEWLEKTLQHATGAKQKVIICCHLPLDAGAASPICILWNYDEVMEIVHRYDCVVACLGGHAHEGGHAVDSRGIHHHILEAVLECPPGRDAYGHIDVYSGHLSLCGTDRMASTDMYFL